MSRRCLPPVVRLAFVLAIASGCSENAVLELFPEDWASGADDVPDAGTQGAAGSPDSGSVGVPTGSLLHRYSFSKPGTLVSDSVGKAHGELRNGASVAEPGSVVLDGADDYVWLPSGLVSQLHSATFMIWATWQGDTPWQRLWDFGNFLLTPEPNAQQQADRTFFLTPMLSSDVINGPAAFVEFRGTLRGTEFGHEYLVADSQTPIIRATEYHYAVAVNEDELTMSLYIDGQFLTERSLQVGSSGIYFLLSDLDDTHNSLGASQYEVDPMLEAQINEFRIYGRALDAEEIATAFDAGPDVEPSL